MPIIADRLRLDSPHLMHADFADSESGSGDTGSASSPAAGPALPSGFTPPTMTDVDSFYDQRTVLVTGGAGFIGSHLTRGLVERGARVRVIDDLSEGRLVNLEPVKDQIDFIEATILDRTKVEMALKGCDVIFHEAALASVPGSIADPVRYNDVNITGTLQLLEAARHHQVARLVFASSSAVYGDQPELPKRENQFPDPLSPYAQQKLTGEQMLNVWWLSYGLSTISLRYFNIFGPGQRPDSAYAAVVAAFAAALLQGKAPRIFGDGSASRDFTYIDNVVQANLRAGMVGLRPMGSGGNGGTSLDRDEAILKAVSGKAFNVACGERITVKELAQVMIEIVGTGVSPQMEPPRAGDVQHSLADISRAERTLGYKPTTTFEEGMRHTIDWYRSQFS